MNMSLGHLTLPPHAERSFSSTELAKLLEPWVVTTVDLFSSSRCCFESNFPMDKSSVAYVTLWNAFARVARRWPLHARRDLFFATANRVYRLGLDMPPLDAFQWRDELSAKF